MNKLKLFVLTALVATLPGLATAAGESGDLVRVNNDVSDTESLQRGAQVFFENCVACHSLEYARYNRVARDLQIPEDLFEQHLLDSDQAIGELMTNALTDDLGGQFFGTTPPDLTVVQRVRGSDWLYGFLRGFYQDDLRPYGVNNAVYNNTGMPHVMVNAQGLCAEAPGPDGCAEFATEGDMTPEEFDTAMYDLVNFLDYVGEPIQLQRQRIGWFVLAFLSVFLVFAWLLYRELWKDIK